MCAPHGNDLSPGSPNTPRLAVKNDSRSSPRFAASVTWGSSCSLDESDRPRYIFARGRIQGRATLPQMRDASWTSTKYRPSPESASPVLTVGGRRVRIGMRIDPAIQKEAEQRLRVTCSNPTLSWRTKNCDGQRSPTARGAALHRHRKYAAWRQCASSFSLRRRVRAVRERVWPIARARVGAPAGDEFPMGIIAAWRTTPT